MTIDLFIDYALKHNESCAIYVGQGGIDIIGKNAVFFDDHGVKHAVNLSGIDAIYGAECMESYDNFGRFLVNDDEIEKIIFLDHGQTVLCGRSTYKTHGVNFIA